MCINTNVETRNAGEFVMHRITLHHFVFALILFGCLLSAKASYAGAQPRWMVSSVSGEALYLKEAEERQPLRLGQVLNVGDRVQTGDDGKVVIARGKQSVLIAANSSFEIRATGSGFFTRIFQSFGTLMFRVDKRPAKHFQVDTPFLHAVVKGTTFTVSVDAGGAAVHVTEGLVEVTAPLADAYGAVSDQTFLVASGYSASISAANGGRLQMGASSGAPRNAEHRHQIRSDLGASHLNIEKASKGLLRGYSAENKANTKGATRKSQTAQRAKQSQAKGAKGGISQKDGRGLPPGLDGAIPGGGANYFIADLVGQSASASKGKGKGKGKKK